ncbi:unnamed protein product [Bursaphelenchus okinawaensis]|uniref:FIT family protein n=1 Tax=Bursaphelenchus okinawaensis TaxID=465554 RepID=A0A811JRI9_9BILA|nr:unnamed protein product [Bursaphelenchus okinawaensis]CAG9079569.1 unnamed protein product [Bursaphelenchus okinawaensis]
MSNNRGRPPPQRKLSSPTTATDVVFGVLVQISRKFLFISPAKKAIFHFLMILVLSIYSVYSTLPEVYLAQKHNILNLYFTKIGWFWTLLVLVPFVSLTSYIHHNSIQTTFVHLMRLVVATGFWYICTHAFLHVEKVTGKCLGMPDALNRHTCSHDGGKWVPGFDISGHAFILLYSILLMSEEAISFRHWPTTPLHNHISHDYHRNQTKTVQWLFIAIFALHCIWDIQLIVTSLYFHTISHKVIGSLFAIGAWIVTYRVWYPKEVLLSLPTRRKNSLVVPSTKKAW